MSAFARMPKVSALALPAGILSLIVLMIVVPIIAGMAMGYGLDSDDER